MKGIRFSNAPRLSRSGVNRFEGRTDAISGRFALQNYRTFQSNTWLIRVLCANEPRAGQRWHDETLAHDLKSAGRELRPL
jgi:hypothetical protein